MKYFSSSKMSNALCSAFSTLAITAVAIGAYASPLFMPGVAYANNGLTVSANPNTGTLTPGQSLEIRVSDPSGTTDAVSDSCFVNNVDVNSTFHNVAPGDYRYTYTVGAGDANRAAGTIPINCTLHQSVSVTINAFDDNNTVAINTTGTTTDVTPSFSMVSISPNSGSLIAGNTATVTFTEAHNQSNLTLTGPYCKVNAVDVSSSWHSVGGGQYVATYTVGPNDGERPAGNIPIGCYMGNSAGTAFASAWSDNNTLAIDTNGDGVISNGTSTLGFTISANPSSGTLHTGDQLTVDFQDPLPSGDVVVGSGGCRVNNVDVASSYTYHGNGLYSVTYAVGAGDANRSAGQVPVDCQLQNHTGSVHLVNFTDNNTVAIDTTTSGGSNGGTASSTPLAFTVYAVPGTGTYTAGHQIEVHFQETHNDGNLVLDGACRVNDVDVASSIRNVTDGQYIVYYTIGSSDAERAAGHVPVTCSFRDQTTGATSTLSAFTDSNTVAIDTNGDGSITEPAGGTTPFVSTVSTTPSSGTITEGGTVAVSIQEGTNDATFTPTSCVVNGSDVASTFQNLSNGLYKFTYTVGHGDANQTAGHLPIYCALRNNSSQTITVSSFTDSNTVAICPLNDCSTGGNGTTTDVGTLHVDSIEQVRSTAVAGGGWNQGWAWKFHMTVPSNESALRFKFDDWTHTDGTTHLGTANDMRISSAQASNASPVVITTAGQYPGDALNLTTDLDPNTPGRQVDVLVETQVPLGTLNGSYTTNYGVRSM